MLCLALDTATAAVGAAIVSGDRVLSRAVTVGAMKHGEMLAPMVAQALADAGAQPGDLSLIAVGTGPGPFTGLRVGLVHARVMGLALGIPVHGVCSLDVIAAEVVANGPAPGDFLVATDARRREVYWARYGPTGTRQGAAQVGPASDIPQVGELPSHGAGALLYPQSFADAAGPEYPDPGILGLLAAATAALGLPPASTDPLYLRRPDAQVNPGHKKVLR